MHEHFLSMMSRAKKLGLFDAEWYQQQHRLKFESEEDAFYDYIRKSWFSDISPSQKFDNKWYLQVNHDVYNMGESPLLHYLDYGIEEGRPSRALQGLWTPKSEYISSVKPNHTKKYAIVLHIFYDDFVRVFADALLGVDFDFDLLITASNAFIASQAEQIFQSNKRVRKIVVKVVPNRGRNFPFLVEFGSALLEYDFFCHLHSKKSLHSGKTQTHWAAYLLEYLINEKQVLNHALELLETNENLGLYYPISYWGMPTWVNHWLKNKGLGKEFLSNEIGLNPDHIADFFAFPVGGMFWARSQALKQLLNRKWTYEDFPAEPVPADGTILHVLERSLAFFCQAEGYKQLFYSPSSGQFTDDDSFIFQPYLLDRFINFKNELTNFDIISFDLFDTLVKRSNHEPDYAKSIVPSRLGLEISGEEYVELRNATETSLRRSNNWAGDVDIFQICKEIIEHSRLNCDPQLLAETEFQIDLEIITPKHLMVDLLNSLLQKGKVIYIITDTYYTKLQIQTIIDSVGIKGDCLLFVSSDLKLRKDNSSMWHHVLKHLTNIDMKENFIHIGDNVGSDCQNPGDLGLRHSHILSPMDKWNALGLPFFGKINPGNTSNLAKWGSLVAQVGDNPFIY